MKPVGLILPLIFAGTLMAAEPTPAPAPADPAVTSPITTVITATTPATSPAAKSAVDPAAKLSPGVSQMLTANLPKYTPPEAMPAAAKPTTGEPSPDVIELPKVVVKQKKRPRLGDEVMMTNKAFNEKLAKEKTSSFDRDFLNKYGFLGGASAAERARDEYDRAQRDQMIKDVSVMAKALEQEDPAAAKALRDTANKP
jgi:hypothetical protein